MAEIVEVQLTSEEKALYESICWDLDVLAKREDRFEQFEAMGQLAESLLERNVVPQHRLDYFIDPEMNVGGYGKSRMEVFERNGTSGRDIFRHPHFLTHLRYFIHGPDLPKATITGFCKIIEDDAGTSGMVLDQIKKFVRKEVRDRRLSATDAPDEFFKLANEIGKPRLAENVRSAAKSVRS